MYNVKEVVANRASRFTYGHRMCAGCGAPVVARMILRAVHPEDHVVIANANTKFIVFGGDGGTYDIGLQSLSGAMERGHDMTYVCYNLQTPQHLLLEV